MDIEKKQSDKLPSKATQVSAQVKRSRDCKQIFYLLKSLRNKKSQFKNKINNCKSYTPTKEDRMKIRQIDRY